MDGSRALYHDSGQDFVARKINTGESSLVYDSKNYEDRPFHPIQCPFCPVYSYSTRSHKTHISEYHGHHLPFACDMCSKGFFSKSALIHHRQTHSGRQYQCHICHSKFFLKHHLKKHLNGIHKVEKVDLYV